jgi:hypothetical protein
MSVPHLRKSEAESAHLLDLLKSSYPYFYSYLNIFLSTTFPIFLFLSNYFAIPIFYFLLDYFPIQLFLLFRISQTTYLSSYLYLTLTL